MPTGSHSKIKETRSLSLQKTNSILRGPLENSKKVLYNFSLEIILLKKQKNDKETANHQIAPKFMSKSLFQISANKEKSQAKDRKDGKAKKNKSFCGVSKK
jgi:hypothetical protein